MSFLKSQFFTFLAVCFSLGACSSDTLPPLVASNIEITEAMPGRNMSAGYLDLTNNTDVAISISSVVSPQFKSVEMHESLLENGVARMRSVPELSIPADSTIALKRGGKHLMLMHANGSTEQITLNFLSGDTILLAVQTSISARID
jgi:copper(I)-binding protein